MNLDFNEKFVPTIKIYSVFLIYSFILLLFCTTSSPLDLINTWNDSNIFFTMGKSLMNGLVPYRDLFEQKGPLLFFINGIGYLISNNSYTGIYILQSFSLSITMFFAYKISILYTSRSWSIMTAISLPVFIYYSTSYSGGGNSAEEYCLPFMMISLYYFLSYFKDHLNIKHNPKIMLLHGVTSSCVFLIKFNITAFWVGFAIVILIKLLINKQFKNIVHNIICGIIGIMLPIIPFAIYFIIKQSLQDAISMYFLLNFQYAEDFSSHRGLVKTFLFTIGKIIIVHPFLFTSITSSIILTAKNKKNLPVFGRYAVILSSVILYLSIYGSGHSSKYYIIPFSIFAIFGIIYIISLFETLTLKRKTLYKLILIILVMNIFSNYIFVNHAHLIKSKNNKSAQYVFADIINSQRNPSLLELTEPAATCGDGFLTAANLLPATKYFSTPNIPFDKFPFPYMAQLDLIQNKKVKFLVSMERLKRTKEEFTIPPMGNLPIHFKIQEAINTNYIPIKSMIQKNGAGEHIYTLYMIKDQ